MPFSRHRFNSTGRHRQGCPAAPAELGSAREGEDSSPPSPRLASALTQLLTEQPKCPQWHRTSGKAMLRTQGEDTAPAAPVHSCTTLCCHQITNNYWIWCGCRSTWYLRANPGPLNQIHNWTNLDSDYFQFTVLLGRGSTARASVTTPTLGYEVAGGFCDVHLRWLNLEQVLLKIKLFKNLS